MNTTTTSIEEIEEWRVIAEFPNYEVSNLGRVRSWHPVFNSGKRPAKPHLLALSPNMSGYTCFTLANDGKHYGRLLHQIVAKAFCEKADPSYKIVRHDDGNPQNCRATNLIWGTQAQNREDQFRHGNAAHGEDCHRAKLTNEQAREIFNDGASTCTELALKYGVTPSTISSIRCGKSRKRSGHNGKSPGAVGMGGRRIPKKITAEQAREIYMSTEKHADLAGKFGLSVPTVHYIQTGHLWRRETEGLVPPEKTKRGWPVGRKTTLHKLTPEIVREIFLSPLLGREIAKKYGVAEGHVSQIRSRKVGTDHTDGLVAPSRLKVQVLDADKAREIFSMPGTVREMGAKYGVSGSTISLIRQRLSWAHATKDLPGVVAGC